MIVVRKQVQSCVFEKRARLLKVIAIFFIPLFCQTLLVASGSKNEVPASDVTKEIEQKLVDVKRQLGMHENKKNEINQQMIEAKKKLDAAKPYFQELEARVTENAKAANTTQRQKAAKERMLEVVKRKKDKAERDVEQAKKNKEAALQEMQNLIKEREDAEAGAAEAQRLLQSPLDEIQKISAESDFKIIQNKIKTLCYQIEKSKKKQSQLVLEIEKVIKKFGDVMADFRAAKSDADAAESQFKNTLVDQKNVVDMYAKSNEEKSSKDAVVKKLYEELGAINKAIENAKNEIKKLEQELIAAKAQDRKNFEVVQKRLAQEKAEQKAQAEAAGIILSAKENVAKIEVATAVTLDNMKQKTNDELDQFTQETTKKIEKIENEKHKKIEQMYEALQNALDAIDLDTQRALETVGS